MTTRRAPRFHGLAKRFSTSEIIARPAADLLYIRVRTVAKKKNARARARG